MSDIDRGNSDWLTSHWAVTRTEIEAPPTADAPPVIPGFAMERILGQGGMGTVYLARHLQLNRLVALKVLRGQALDQPDALRRFQYEAEMIAHLRHPHIVQIYDVGRVQGTSYIALEYVDGGTLATCWNEFVFDPSLKGDARKARLDKILVLVETLGRAIHSAHVQGVIHRDLKPANILLQNDSPLAACDDPSAPSLALASSAEATTPGLIPKISDFGLAMRFRAGTRLTQAGMVVGTPAYMAPEQISGADPLGPSVDVYSLGVILYELLTNQLPWDGADPVELLKRVAFEDLVPLRRCVPTLPADLENITSKCLARTPQDRYPSALALAADLARFRNGEPLSIRPVSELTRLWHWSRRQPLVAGLVVALIILLVLGLVIIAGLWQRAEQHLEEANSRQQALEQSLIRHRTVRQLSTAIELGRSYRAAGMWPEAEAAFQQAVTIYEDLVRKEPYDYSHLSGLAGSYEAMGRTLALQRRHEEAIEWLKRAVRTECRAMDLARDDRLYRQMLSDHYGFLATSLRELGRADELAAVIADRAALWPNHGVMQVEIAREFIRSRKNPFPPASPQSWDTLAVEALKRAKAAHFKAWPELLAEPLFEPILPQLRELALASE